MQQASTSYSKADIFLSCVAEKYVSKEMIVQKNSLIRVISGEMKMVLPGHTYVLGPGDTILFPRNQLTRIIKYPVNGQPYKSVCINFTPEFLHKYYASHKVLPQAQVTPQVKIIDRHALLDSLFNSLVPYFSLSDELPAGIASVKIEEAIVILRSVDKYAHDMLAHFEELGKISLEDFMEKHYMFNMPAEKFGYLTGRSLTTFKRDFKKAYNTTPQKWLTQKRLQLAWYQIAEENKKPNDVYFDAGFENLSHFSFAFKKQYGLSPSQLREKQVLM